MAEKSLQKRISGEPLPVGGTAKPAVWKRQQSNDLGVEEQHSHCKHMCCASLAGQPEGLDTDIEHPGDAAAWLVGGRGMSTVGSDEASARGSRCCSVSSVRTVGCE